MSCNCVHCQDDIQYGKTVISELREFFINRMTVDSETQDARRRDFNQAIFVIKDDGSTAQAFNNMDMRMVLRCFDDAAKDWRRTFCDVEGCRRR